MKKFLALLAFASTLATPAAAWQQGKIFYVVNHVYDAHLAIESVAFNTRVFPVRLTLPQETSSFKFFETSPPLPCLVKVTITQLFGPPVTAPTLFNGCTQNTITVTGKGSEILNAFNFYYN